MRKTTFLFTLLLGLLFSVGAWAQAVTVNVVSIGNPPSSTGSITGDVGNKVYTSGSQSGLAGLTISGYNLNQYSNWNGNAWMAVQAASAVNTVGTITITAPSGYKILSYQFNARTGSSSGSSSVTAGTTTKTLSQDETKGFVVTGVNAASTTFTMTHTSSVQYQNISDFSVTLIPEAQSLTQEAWTLFPTTAINGGKYPYVKVTTPSNSEYYTIDHFDLWTRTGEGASTSYMLISESPNGNLVKNEVLAVSTNNPTATDVDKKALRYLFSEPVLLKGGTVYYLYFATALAANSTDAYTLTNQRIAAYPNGGATDNWVQNNYGPQYSTILTAVDAPAVTDMEGNELSES